MKKTFFLIFLLACTYHVFANVDTVRVPIERRFFHDKITEEQKLLDRFDGKSDGVIRVGANDEINASVTDVMTRGINLVADAIELNNKISKNQEKVKYLRLVENLVKNFRAGLKSKAFNPTYAQILVNAFEKSMQANIEGISMAPYIEAIPYAAGKIITDIFPENTGYKECKKILFLKFAAIYPQKILQYLEPYAGETFADSLIVICARYNPTAVYSASQAPNTTIGRLIHNSTNPIVMTVVQISKTPNALLYFPFLDDILKGRKTIADIKKYVGDNAENYDSIGYFKLMVQTEIEYFKRMLPPTRDTAIAMFGPNGLRESLQEKALHHFISPINALHDQGNLSIRMRAIDPLSAIDLYYMIVMGENDIYTSSYKHSFNRLLQRLGKNAKTDSLLLSVHFDYFKKFIKMAANFNMLDTFLRLMPPQRSQMLMRAFVGNLDQTNSLEDAVDVADSYSSITDKKLLKTMLAHVIDYENIAEQNNSERGKRIYGLLKMIFLSGDSSNHIDLTKTIGIPSIYTIDSPVLTDDSGRIIQQVFFYGDADGQGIFNGFLNSFSPVNWKVNLKPEWAEIKSIKGPKIWIYANRPLNNDKNLDDTAQLHLVKYLEQNNLLPSIVVHRGHSYWLPSTVNKMMGNARIVVLGSCGGYKNLNEILEINPDAHIISTKEVGKADINKPVINYINQTLVSGKTLVWKNMWSTLTKQFAAGDWSTKEAWDDYIPPYKNLGVIFLKAYSAKKGE